MESTSGFRVGPYCFNKSRRKVTILFFVVFTKCLSDDEGRLTFVPVLNYLSSLVLSREDVLGSRGVVPPFLTSSLDGGEW